MTGSIFCQHTKNASIFHVLFLPSGVCQFCGAQVLEPLGATAAHEHFDKNAGRETQTAPATEDIPPVSNKRYATLDKIVQEAEARRARMTEIGRVKRAREGSGATGTNVPQPINTVFPKLDNTWKDPDA